MEVHCICDSGLTVESSSKAFRICALVYLLPVVITINKRT